jgi:hypothetical protein
MERGEKASLDPQAAGLVDDEDAERGKPFYQRASFWTGPFLFGLGVLLAIGAGIAWYLVGGFPGDHDEHATVNVPGQQVVELPEGDVRLNHENNATRSGDSTILDDKPDGLDVQVAPAGGGEPLEVDEVPGWTFSATVNDRGHEPFRKIDVPSEGEYVVQATADGLPPLGSPALAKAPAADDNGPEITVGAGPWTPFDSKLAGAVLAGLVIFLLVYGLSLPFKLMGRNR